MPAHRPIEERFAEKYVISPETGCWNWTGAKVAGGYGHLGRYRAEPILAHRFSYGHHIGPVPDDKIVRHACNNSSCVNPDHLFLGDHEDNMRDLADSGHRRGRNTGTTLTGGQLHRLKELMFSEGYTQRKVAEALGVHLSTVQRALYRGEVVSLPDVDKKAQRIYLTDEQREQAIQMLAAGNRVMTVANHFGVDRKTIRNLRPDTIAPPPRGRPKN